MAVYVTADLHGYPLKDFLGFLKKTGFGNDDFLFILGDVIDRNGDGGVEILRWMMCQPNVQFILGNYEKMMLDSAFVFDEITEESVNALSSDKMDQLSGWLACGGDVALHSLKELKHKDPELVEEMIHFCAEAPLYESVTVESKDYLLVHSGLGNFSIEKSLRVIQRMSFCGPDRNSKIVILTMLKQLSVTPRLNTMVSSITAEL